MKVLALDCATPRGSVCLMEEQRLVVQIQLENHLTHTESLLPTIANLLREAKWDLSFLNGLAITIGPGSFTSLRVGLSTLKGFAQTFSFSLVGVSSLLALAHNALLSEVPVAAVLDAKRGEVYAAIYQFRKNDPRSTIHDPRILFPEQAIPPEKLCKTLKELDSCILLGDGAIAYQKLFQTELGDKFFFGSPPMMTPQAKWVAHLGSSRLMKGEGNDWKRLTPNYLRASDAEKIKN